MSSEALYEQYKDALKRGHVAALRGHVEEALLAYADAARIAPERPTPHVSAGTALLRRKRPAEALRHYEVAIQIAPRDESALLGRAQALGALNRRGEAADAFDALAEVQAGSGRLADAVDAARRGLEMAEGRERRRTLERLIARLRASEPGEPGRVALERALQVLDGVAVPRPAAGHPRAGHPAGPKSGTAAPDAERVVEAPRHAEPAAETPAPAASAAESPMPPAVADAPAGDAGDAEARAEDGIAPVPSASPDTVAAEPEIVGAQAVGSVEGPAASEAPESRAASEANPAAAGLTDASSAASTPVGQEPELEPTLPAARDIPAGVTAAELMARAEAAVEAQVPSQAVDALLDLAALHTRDGRIDAALDACYTAVSFDPDNIALHFSLVELYAARGWSTLVAEKLDLLQRLGELDGDQAVLADVAGVRAALA